MNKIILKQIKNTPLFKNFDLRTLEAIFNDYKNHFYIKKYATDQIIYLQNQKCTSLDLILEGEIIIKIIDINGNVMVMDSFKTSDDFSGNLLFLKDAYYPMTVFSNSETKVLHLKKELILQLSHNNKKFLETLLESIGTKNFLLTQRVTLLSLETLRDKIIFYLKQRSLQEHDKVLKIKNSKKEIASKLCVARTSLSRELNALKKEGFIDYDHKTFFLKDKLFSTNL